MALAAAQVTAALVARLIAADTSAGAQVEAGRAWPLAESELPAILVVPGGDEELDSDDVTWPQLQTHTLPLLIQGRVRDVADLDGAMDDLAEEILDAINDTEAHATLDPLVGCNVVARAIRREVADPAGESATGQVTVRVEVTFQTAANDPSTLI